MDGEVLIVEGLQYLPAQKNQSTIDCPSVYCPKMLKCYCSATKVCQLVQIASGPAAIYVMDTVEAAMLSPPI